MAKISSIEGAWPLWVRQNGRTGDLYQVQVGPKTTTRRLLRAVAFVSLPRTDETGALTGSVDVMKMQGSSGTFRITIAAPLAGALIVGIQKAGHFSTDEWFNHPLIENGGLEGAKKAVVSFLENQVKISDIWKDYIIPRA